MYLVKPTCKETCYWMDGHEYSKTKEGYWTKKESQPFYLSEVSESSAPMNVLYKLLMIEGMESLENLSEEIIAYARYN